MNRRNIFLGLVIMGALYCTVTGITGCAQIGMPTGGPRDSVAPVLVLAQPAERKTNFTGNKIELIFNEYIDVQDIQNNVLVSPYPKINPNISFKLKTITIKLKDTLLENTTYAINFGNSLKDLNEGNPFRNYTYVFSTGNSIDTFTLRGKAVLAESGKADSTMLALLYKNAPDTAVEHRKPDYIARLNAQGDFLFTNLSEGNYKLYALKDADGSKTYNSVIETFGFMDADVFVRDTMDAGTLYAYAEEKDIKKPAAAVTEKGPEKKLRYSTSASPSSPQSLLAPFELVFSKPVKLANDTKIILMDSSWRKINTGSITLDSTKKILRFTANWAPEFDYRLIIGNDAVTDTLGNGLVKTDTVQFKTKGESDYARLLLRFNKYDTARHPVLQFFKGEEMIKSVPVKGSAWSDKLFEPGEYELRVLYDDNNNGKWDPGNYKQKKQPERVITFSKKLTIKVNWDNERDIEL